MGAGFIPPILDKNSFEEALRVPSDSAMDMSKRLAKEEGILAGISGGANVCAAVEVIFVQEILLSFSEIGRGRLTKQIYIRLV